MARIVLTGAGGALGHVTATRLRNEGHDVACLDLSVAPDMGPAELWYACDLSDPDSARAAVAGAVERLGGLEGLVHVAGGFGYKRVEAGIIDEWRRLQATNVETALNLFEAAVPLLADGGAIVTIGAAAAQRAAAGMAPYAAAKSGIARLTEALAAELAPRRIRVNSVLPRTIDTPDNRAAMPDADVSAWTSPEAIADVIAFLLGTGARAINGAHIPVTNAA